MNIIKWLKEEKYSDLGKGYIANWQRLVDFAWFIFTVVVILGMVYGYIKYSHLH